MELYRNYLSTHPGLNPSFDIEEFERNANIYLKIYKDFLPQHLTADILDIGCGQGHFLYLLKKIGYIHAVGVDASEEQVNFGKRLHLNVHCSHAFQFLDGRTQWDLVSMQEVLEHMPRQDVIDFLHRVHQSLKSGGLLLVKVPNMENPFNLAARYIDFTHECGFTSHSLIQVMSMAGFRDIGIYPYKPAPLKINRGIHHVIRRLCDIILNKLYEIPIGTSAHAYDYQHYKRIFAVAYK